MKKFAKIVSIIMAIAIIATVSVCFVACNKDGEGLRFAAPQGTPALAIAKLSGYIDGQKVNYAVVSPENIASEMRDEKADLVIMPVNGGANLIRQHVAQYGNTNYKLVSVAVDGSLYMIGNTEDGGTITMDDIKGKKIACIGQTGVPGLVFRYVMENNGIEIITEGVPTESQVFVEYVGDGSKAGQRLAGKMVDFAVVGEPAATQLTT
ncbi:MAG: hypothetical protein K2M36_04645, partial [Clostridia bacterium]|nr:hypothetical protein [Clostridia bacterium]